MKFVISCIFAFGIAGIANAQSVNFSSGVPQSYVDSAVSAIAGSMPQPATTVPSPDTNTGAVGAAANYMRADSVRPARYRSSSCALVSGSCTMSWSSTFSVVPNPLGDPAVVNTSAGTVSIKCNWTAVTTTSGTVNCKSQSLSVTISLGPLTFLASPSDGLTVAGTVVPPL